MKSDSKHSTRPQDNVASDTKQPSSPASNTDHEQSKASSASPNQRSGQWSGARPQSTKEFATAHHPVAQLPADDAPAEERLLNNDREANIPLHADTIPTDGNSQQRAEHNHTAHSTSNNAQPALDAQQQPDWLSELEARSRTAQKDFIDNISTRLKRPRMTQPPQHPFRGAPSFWGEFAWSEEERIQRFTQHFQEVGGHVTTVANLQEAGQWIAEHARHLGAQYIVRQQLPELEQLQLETQLPETHISVWNSDPAEPWKARAAEADIGVVLADGAAAYTGTVMVTSAAQQGRSVSLLPTVCIVLLPKERLHTRLGELLIPLDMRGREHLPAGVHFISGPSRSSDIENDLTIGVHGPGIIYTLLIG